MKNIIYFILFLLTSCSNTKPKSDTPFVSKYDTINEYLPMFNQTDLDSVIDSTFEKSNTYAYINNQLISQVKYEVKSSFDSVFNQKLEVTTDDSNKLYTLTYYSLNSKQKLTLEEAYNIDSNFVNYFDTKLIYLSDFPVRTSCVSLNCIVSTSSKLVHYKNGQKIHTLDLFKDSLKTKGTSTELIGMQQYDSNQFLIGYNLMLFKNFDKKTVFYLYDTNLKQLSKALEIQEDKHFWSAPVLNDSFIFQNKYLFIKQHQNSKNRYLKIKLEED